MLSSTLGALVGVYYLFTFNQSKNLQKAIILFSISMMVIHSKCLLNNDNLQV
jgi:zinc transporter ZupT